jgi:hypothetical protein
MPLGAIPGFEIVQSDAQRDKNYSALSGTMHALAHTMPEMICALDTHNTTNIKNPFRERAR